MRTAANWEESKSILIYVSTCFSFWCNRVWIVKNRWSPWSKHPERNIIFHNFLCKRAKNTGTITIIFWGLLGRVCQFFPWIIIEYYSCYFWQLDSWKSLNYKSSAASTKYDKISLINLTICQALWQEKWKRVYNRLHVLYHLINASAFYAFWMNRPDDILTAGWFFKCIFHESGCIYMNASIIIRVVYV